MIDYTLVVLLIILLLILEASHVVFVKVKGEVFYF